MAREPGVQRRHQQWHEDHRGERRRFSRDELARALRASKEAAVPMEFIIENGSYFKTVTVDYHGGLRYPHLERATGVSDALTAIAKARQ
jgi:hypothetical protein